MASPSHGIDSKHTQAHLCTHRAQILFLRAHTHTHSLSQNVNTLHYCLASSRQSPPPGEHVELQIKITGQANYSSANMCTPSSCIHLHQHRGEIKKKEDFAEHSVSMTQFQGDAQLGALSSSPPSCLLHLQLLGTLSLSLRCRCETLSSLQSPWS